MAADKRPAAKTAQQLFASAFNTPRDPRSPEYKAGVLAALKFRMGEAPTVILPDYASGHQGTAREDAFFAGVSEGHSVWRRYTTEASPDSS